MPLASLPLFTVRVVEAAAVSENEATPETSSQPVNSKPSLGKALSDTLRVALALVSVGETVPPSPATTLICTLAPRTAMGSFFTRPGCTPLGVGIFFSGLGRVSSFS